MKTVFLLLGLCFALLLPSSFAADKPSELTRLMRQMLSYIKQEKLQIENNKPALHFPTTLQKVSKAKITAGKKISNEHRQYIADFFGELNHYYQKQDSAERRTGFNLLVSSCINCHQHECPGPIVVIKKNLLEPTEQ